MSSASTTVHLIGDSTIAEKEASARPETGCGTPFAEYFDDDGDLEDTHEVYSELTRAVARDRDVPLIDMDEQSQSLLRELGPEASKSLYRHLLPGDHPNYPDGVTDDTYFSQRGAHRMAELVLDGVGELELGLAGRVVRDER